MVVENLERALDPMIARIAPTKRLAAGKALASSRPNPVLAVVGWELRRFCASRLFWLQALGFFGFSLFLTWVQGTILHIDYRRFSGFIAGTSAWGLTLTLPTVLLLLVLLLPFVTADGVTRDLQRRTHELLMTTALPTWAYVWGRYLMGLVMSLGLAGLLLGATMGMGLLLHLTIPTYPLPQLGAVLLLWVGMILPATVLVSSLSFALGTLFPRQSTQVKIVILVGWVVGVEILPIGLGRNLSSTWYSDWDPTSAVTALKMLSQYPVDQLHTATSTAQFQQTLLTLENMSPNIGGWFAPHLALAGVGLVLVVLAALAFQRFRETFNG